MRDLLATLLFAFIGAMAWRRLVKNGYTRAAASGIVCFAAVQASVCVAANMVSAAVLALGMYAVSASAVSLVRERDVRGIIRAGGALAAAQIMIPFGGLFTAALLPGLIAAPRSQDERRKAVGVLLLLLFLPVLSAILSATLHWSLAPAPVRPAIGHILVDGAFLALLPSLTFVGFRTRGWVAFIPFLAGAALLIAILTGEASGFGYAPLMLAPAATCILLIAVSEWTATASRAGRALLLFSLSTAAMLGVAALS
ncbi:MAG TPA: hypothetical protein VHW69_06575 [Rhizomicrobium sp.]|nr:hypothetical protein [Rhizomicrobium sp.]